MMFPPLEHDLLYLFVIGPGMGETVLLRIPPDHWVVIDSFRSNQRAAALEVLAEYDAVWTCAILTHPHEDHYSGFDEVIAANEAGTIGCVHPVVEFFDGNVTVDPYQHLSQGAKPVYSAIADRWTDGRTGKWVTHRGTSLSVGDATLTSLNPAAPVQPGDWSGDKNELSSAILLEWHGVRLLLGADVVNSKWQDIGSEFSSLADHVGLKVPHHGSREAIHECFAAGDSDRCWIVTPYSRGSLQPDVPGGKKLPRPEDGDGLDILLQNVDEVLLTSIPFQHSHENETWTATRQDIIAELESAANTMILPNGKKGRILGKSDSLTCHVIVAFDDSGAIDSPVVRGTGSVNVTQGGADSVTRVSEETQL